MSFVNIFDSKGDVRRKQDIKKLLQSVKQSQVDAAKKSVAIELTDLVLRSRPLCRRYKNQPLAGIYREIYQQVKYILQNKIAQECCQKNFSDAIDEELLEQLQLQVFRQILDDTRLKALALHAQKQLPNSSLRSYALTELVKGIKISDRLCRPHKEAFKNEFYPLIYEEAVAQTMSYICTNIDKYDPKRGQGKFMSWVNFKLDKMVLSCRRQFDLSATYNSLSVPDFDLIPAPVNSRKLGDLLYQHIEQDVLGVFQKTFVIGNPQANFRAIALKRLSGKTWKEIARDLNSKIPVVSSFYKRNCQKFQPLLKKALTE